MLAEIQAVSVLGLIVGHYPIRGCFDIKQAIPEQGGNQPRIDRTADLLMS